MSQQVKEKQAGRRLGAGVIASLSGLAVLLIFVIQNREDVKVHFLVWSLSGRCGLHHCDGGIRGVGVVRVGRDASSQTPQGTP